MSVTALAIAAAPRKPISQFVKEPPPALRAALHGWVFLRLAKAHVGFLSKP